MTRDPLEVSSTNCDGWNHPADQTQVRANIELSHQRITISRRHMISDMYIYILIYTVQIANGLQAFLYFFVSWREEHDREKRNQELPVHPHLQAPARSQNAIKL